MRRSRVHTLIRRYGRRVGAAALAMALASCTSGTGSDGALTVSCGAVGRELELCRRAVEAWTRRTKKPARVISAPADSGERLGLYQLLLAARSPAIDIFLIDTTWPGMMSESFVDLSGKVDARELFPAFVRNNTVRGRLAAIPWFIDAGLLYFRKDLLEKHGEAPPESWDELTRTAKRIQALERKAGNDRFWGFVFQGRAYEGLTCNALEWIESAGGGTFVDAEGAVTIDNPGAARALTLAASWVGAISPPGVLNYMEEEARGVFQAGNALYMRNWPYAWKLAQAPDSPVRGKVGVSVLPSGAGGTAATLGGWSLAVSRYSRHAEDAVDLVLELTGKAEQKRRAIEAGLNPALRSLYDDPELLASHPIASRLRQVFESAVPRPSRVTGARYGRVSAEVRDRVHGLLEERAGEARVREELAAAKGALERIGRGGTW